MHYNLENLYSQEIMPDFLGSFLHTENMTFAFWKIKSGSILPEHSHIHEQVAHLTEGSFELTIDGKTTILTPGTVSVISSGKKHSGKALIDCTILDVFSPVREDYKF